MGSGERDSVSVVFVRLPASSGRPLSAIGAPSVDVLVLKVVLRSRCSVGKIEWYPNPIPLGNKFEDAWRLGTRQSRGSWAWNSIFVSIVNLVEGK